MREKERTEEGEKFNTKRFLNIITVDFCFIQSFTNSFIHSFLFLLLLLLGNLRNGGEGDHGVQRDVRARSKPVQKVVQPLAHEKPPRVHLVPHLNEGQKNLRRERDRRKEGRKERKKERKKAKKGGM